MLKVGIIGSGFGLYGLLPAFNAVEDCQVMSICGDKTDRLLEYCKSINLKNIYSDWQSMLEVENLDALAIAAPPDIQYKIAKVAIEKGLHIFAEKPLAVNCQQAEDLLLLAQKRKIIHIIDFIFPEIEEWQNVKNILDSKKYGDLKHISVNWDFWSHDLKNKISSWKTDVDKGGGALAFYFSHALFYLEYYVGKIIDIKSLFSFSEASKNGGEVGVDMLLKFKDGVVGNAHICSNNKGLNSHEIIFICANATIILKNSNNITENFIVNIMNQKVSRQLLVKKKNIIKDDEDERVRVVKKIVSRFVVGCLAKKQVYPSFAEGVRVQRLIEEVRENKM